MALRMTSAVRSGCDQIDLPRAILVVNRSSISLASNSMFWRTIPKTSADAIAIALSWSMAIPITTGVKGVLNSWLRTARK